LSFRAGEAEDSVDAQIFGQCGPSGPSMQTLGCVLTIAAQRAPGQSGNRLVRVQSFADQSQQPASDKASENLVIQCNDRFVAAGSP